MSTPQNMKNEFDKSRIENIGFGYIWTILTGKNRQYSEFGDVLKGNIIKGDFKGKVRIRNLYRCLTKAEREMNEYFKNKYFNSKKC